MSRGQNIQRKTKGEEEGVTHANRYALTVYKELVSGKGLLAPSQVDTLVKTLLEKHPHHGRMLIVMQHAGLWLPIAVALKIGDVDRDQSVLRISRGWSMKGEYPIPKRTGRGFISQGELSPTCVPLSTPVVTAIDEQIAYLDRVGLPIGVHDWLFPGRLSGHPWAAAIFNHVVIHPVLRELQFPMVSQKELYFSMMRMRIEEKVAKLPTAIPVTPACSHPNCPRQGIPRHHPTDLPVPCATEIPRPDSPVVHSPQGGCHENY